jgi:hypothetical protein
MAERTGLEFVCAGKGISKLLIIKDRVVPLYPRKTPLVPPTLDDDEGPSLDDRRFAYI